MLFIFTVFLSRDILDLIRESGKIGDNAKRAYLGVGGGGWGAKTNKTEIIFE